VDNFTGAAPQSGHVQVPDFGECYMARPCRFELPGTPDTTGDCFESTKAISLCHLENDFDAFDRDYRDRRLLADTVARYLREATAREVSGGELGHPPQAGTEDRVGGQ